jgi:hypothetical protein
MITVGPNNLRVKKLGFVRTADTYKDADVRFEDNSGSIVAQATPDYDSVAVGEVAYANAADEILTAGQSYHLTVNTADSNGYRGNFGAPNTWSVRSADAMLVRGTDQDRADPSMLAYVDFQYEVVT